MTTGTSAVPPMSAFGGRQGNGWAIAFVRNCVQGEPKILPPDRQNEKARAALYNAAKSRGFRLVTTTYNGNLWACITGLLKDEKPAFVEADVDSLDDEDDDDDQ